MAIEISAEGSREAVIRRIEAWAPKEVKEGDPQPLTEEEKQLLPLLKALLVAEVKNIHESFNSVRMTALGNCHKGHRRLEVNLVPRQLEL